jgi:CRISPR system Cascade subunit CasD
MGVRVDREGAVKVDYHTAGGGMLGGASYGVAKASGATPQTVVSRRYYLADADFLVGLEGEDEGLLRELDAALAAPVWQLSLGRKAFVPGVPVRLPNRPPRGPGLRSEPLEEVLRGYPWFADPQRASGGSREPSPDRWRMVVELDGPRPGADARLDQPVGAAFLTRQFTVRYVRTEVIGGVPTVEPAADAVHSEV